MLDGSRKISHMTQRNRAENHKVRGQEKENGLKT